MHLFSASISSFECYCVQFCTNITVTGQFQDISQQIQEKSEEYKSLTEREKNLLKELENLRNKKVGGQMQISF